MIKFIITVANHLAANKENLPIVYIAGKVTDLDYSEVFAKFKQKQMELEMRGFWTINPLEFMGESEDWQIAMRKSVILLSVSDHICLLHDWHQSKGAKLERNLSLPLGISMLEDEQTELLPDAPVITKGDLIAALQAQPYPDETPVYIFDHIKNLLADSGDGSSEGIYQFDVSTIDHFGEWAKDEIEFYLEQNDGKAPRPWIALSFNNPDLEIPE